MEIALEDQYLRVPGEAPLLEVYEALEGTGLYPPFPPVELPGGVGGLLERGGFGQTFFFASEVLGLTFLTPKGHRVRAGGVTVKNVQGYDLVRPFVGSFGLLGRAEEAVFRLRPGRESALLRAPWPGAFPEVGARFLWREGGWLYAFHFGSERELAQLKEALRAEEVPHPVDYRPLFPNGMGVGKGEVEDLRFSWEDGGKIPKPPPLFLKLVEAL
ncbi:MAG: DUF5639 domain-containing protein [Thermaceae bacterium]